MKESERIIDRTFDIAEIYIEKLNLTSLEIDELIAIQEKDEVERQARLKEQAEQKEQNLTFKIPNDTSGCEHRWDGKSVRFVIKKTGEKEYISDDMELDFDTFYENHLSIGASRTCSKCGMEFPAQDIAESSSPIMTQEEYKKRTSEYEKKHPVVKKIWKIMERYCKDKALNYSNRHYHQVVFSVALNNYIEKRILSRYHIQSKTAYEIAREVVTEKEDVILRSSDTYPDEVKDEFVKRLKNLPKSFAWHIHEESLLDIFAVAIHYGQEINTNTTYTKFDRVIRSDNFTHLWKLYCIIPYLTQELFIVVLAFRKFGYDPPAIMDWIAEMKGWINKNLAHYTILMVIIATLIWYLIFA